MALKHNEDPALLEKLRHESGIAKWSLLRDHIERDATFIVASGTDMIEVAYQIAQDNTKQVSQWLDEGQLVKPSPEQIADWQNSQPNFSSVVVAPFVLIQEVSH